jgi:glyoxylase-like metal-dependent hydrolase (beta-lactamase superfamily II)
MKNSHCLVLASGNTTSFSTGPLGVFQSLIDDGYPAKRSYLEKELERAGVKPGNLKLVVLTHGDHDHEKVLIT